jgi:antitoxin VapB
MDTAKLFMNGRSQAVRLPKEYRFEGSQVYIKKVGDVIVLIPYQAPWETFLESLDLFTGDFMPVRQQPILQQREDAFE